MKPERLRNCDYCKEVFSPIVERPGGLLFCSVRCAKDAKRLKQQKQVAQPISPSCAVTSLETSKDISFLLSYRFTSGVYFLKDNSEVVYVGQSTNVIARIGAGHADKIFNEITFIPCDKKYLGETERFWIKKFQPRYNKDYK